MKEHNKKMLDEKQEGSNEENDPSGYPNNPTVDDIFSKYQKFKNINLEDIPKNKGIIEKYGIHKVNEIIEDAPGSVLDIPDPIWMIIWKRSEAWTKRTTSIV